jgi:hypothetical protein
MTGRIKLKYFKSKLQLGHFAYHKSHTQCSDIEKQVSAMMLVALALKLP